MKCQYITLCITSFAKQFTKNVLPTSNDKLKVVKFRHPAIRIK